MKLRHLFAIAILVLFASAALAADMNPALRPLDFFVGNWRCTGTDSFMGPAHATMTNVNAKWGYAGHWLVVDVSQEKTKENPGFMGTVFMGYDEGQKKLVNGWVDNTGGYATAASDGWMGDTITYTGPQHMGTMVMNVRDVFTKGGADKLTHKMLVEENGSWKQVVDESCMKKK
jgi:hypothetical protein